MKFNFTKPVNAILNPTTLIPSGVMFKKSHIRKEYNKYKETFMNTTQKKSFRDSHLFIGIDAHLKNWRVTIRFNAPELKTFSMNPSPLLVERKTPPR